MTTRERVWCAGGFAAGAGCFVLPWGLPDGGGVGGALAGWIGLTGGIILLGAWYMRGWGGRTWK